MQVIHRFVRNFPRNTVTGDEMIACRGEIPDCLGEMWRNGRM